MIHFNVNRIKLAGLIACGTCLVMLGLWALFIRTTKNHMNTDQVNLEETKRKINFCLRTINNQDQVLIDLEESNQRLAKKETMGVASGDIYLWIVNLLLDMQKSNVVEFLEFDQPRIADLTIAPLLPYQAAYCRVRGIGRYHEFGKFLESFENRYPLIRLLRLELEPASDMRSNPNLPGKLSVDMEFLVLVKLSKTNDVVKPTSPKR